MIKFTAIAAVAALFSVLSPAQTPGQADKNAINWTGFYAGLNAGGAFGSSNAQTSTVYSEEGYFDSSSVPAIASAGNQNLNPTGYSAGAQFGYNWQFAPKWVLGAEADFGGFVTSDSATVTAVYPCCSPDNFTITQAVSTNWLSTVRSRVGYAASKRSLVFVSGGAAETQLNYSSLFEDDYDAYESASASVLKTGWAAGGGAAYALNKHWSTGAEYLYLDFGSVTNAGTVLTWDEENFPASPFSHTATLTSNLARAFVNFKF